LSVAQNAFLPHVAMPNWEFENPALANRYTPRRDVDRDGQLRPVGLAVEFSGNPSLTRDEATGS